MLGVFAFLIEIQHLARYPLPPPEPCEMLDSAGFPQKTPNRRPCSGRFLPVCTILFRISPTPIFVRKIIVNFLLIFV